MVGVGSNSLMQTEYAAVLRFEFVPSGRTSGDGEQYPWRDVYMKVLPKGSANVQGGLLGFPALDGLGCSTTESSHFIKSVGVHLP